MLCCDCRHYIVIILTSILLASCNYVEGSPSVAVLGGEAYMRWTVSTTTNGNIIVLGPANSTIVGFINGQTQSRFVAPNVSYTGDISQGIMSFTLHGVTLANVGKYKYILPGNIEDGGQDLVIAESPTITIITELSPPGVVGGNSILNCTAVSTSFPVNHNLAMLSEWKRNGMNITLASKYSVSGTILAVYNLVRADNEDSFTCVAYEDPRKKSKESGGFLLNVLYGPDNVQITPTGDLTVDEEGSVNITCSAECNPMCESYRWQNGNDHTLVGLKHSLVMPKVRREHAGLYICNVTNDATLLSAAAHKKVSVNYGPDNPLQISPSNKSYRVQEYAKIPNISCTSPCFPPCGFEWTGPVISSTGMISLGTVHRSNRGSYTCKGKNPETSKEASRGVVTIYVIFGPDTPDILPSNTLYRLNESNVLPTIQCLADCFPNCTSRWYNGTTAVPRSHDNRLILDKVYRNDAGNYTCRSVNMESKAEREKILQLVVQFAPEMSVKVTPSIVEVNSEVRIECSAHGEPFSYKFYDWIHKLGNNEVRHIKGILVNQSTLGISFPSITIADMGTYICSVDNGIIGRDGSIVQSIEAQVNIIGVPVAFVRDTTFIGETNMSASIRIPFISSPSITDLKFFKTWNNALIANDTDTQVYHTEANISTIFYNTGIVLQGMEAVLNFRNLKESDFGQYTLVLSNNKGTATLIVQLKELAPPSPVEQFYFYKLVGQYMEFYFVPGFNGGHQQTFTIQFKSSGSLDESWTNTSINGLSEMDDRYRRPNGTFIVQVETLQPGRYIFRMFSVNKKNIRMYSHEVPVYIEEEPHTDANIGPSIAGIAGGIGGGVVVIVVTGVAIFLWRRHNNTNKAADGTACVSTAENYEALQAKNNEGSLYQELSNIKSCADTKNSFRRNGPINNTNQPIYINTKQTVCATQDQGNF